MSLPISFISDFGRDDEFVGVVHGVIARIAPEVRVIDIGHEFDQGDIRAGSLALMRAIQYLPKGVALAVIDPGVGTKRKAIAARTEWGVLIGPDKGLLAPAVANLIRICWPGAGGYLRRFCKKGDRPEVSPLFSGRALAILPVVSVGLFPILQQTRPESSDSS